jgi:hypothetical protein
MSLFRLALGVPLPHEEIMMAATAAIAAKVNFFIVFFSFFYFDISMFRYFDVSMLRRFDDSMLRRLT